MVLYMGLWENQFFKHYEFIHSRVASQSNWLLFFITIRVWRNTFGNNPPNAVGWLP